MKAILTLILMIGIGSGALAKTADLSLPISRFQMIPSVEIAPATVENNSVARLYRFKNSRVKKELSFYTKKNKAKLA